MSNDISSVVQPTIKILVLMVKRAEVGVMNPKETVNAKASAIFDLYRMKYGGETQGCCPLIADEIHSAIGGEIVAGELTWYGGTCRRTHWWVEKDGQVIDPMGDWLLSFEEYTGRCEHHRDRAVFDSILPRYEQWRISMATERRQTKAAGPTSVIGENE